MSDTLRCRIVTPAESVLDQPATYVSFPAWDGQKGAMPNTSPFLTRLGVGSLRVEFPGGGSRTYLVESGFAQMQGGTLMILTDLATPAEMIELPAAEKELADALVGRTLDTQERAALDRRQELARARVTIGRRVAERGI